MAIVTWDSNFKGSSITLSQNLLSATIGANYNDIVRATEGKSIGKWYWEVKVVSKTGNAQIAIGIVNNLATTTGLLTSNSRVWYSDGTTSNKYNGTNSPYGSSFTTNDIIGILLDLDSDTIEFYKNGVSQGIAFTGLTATSYYPIVSNATNVGGAELLANFGATTFSYAPKIKGLKSYDGNQSLSFFNKTLILHDGIYKKWIGEVNGTSESTTSIPIMTSNTAPSGIASSSSYWANDVRYLPYRAFNGVVNDGDNSWYSATTTNEWLAYEFTSPIIINEYSISPTIINLDSMPKDFVFEGFENGAWIVLDSRVGISNWEISKPKSFITKNTKPFIKYRLRVFNNNGNTKYIGVADFKMFKAISTYQNIKDWLSVNLIDVKTEGMDSLSPLLDRKVMQIEPQVMTQDSSFVGEGKLYRKKVDLNKYFDLRTISTETRNS